MRLISSKEKIQKLVSAYKDLTDWELHFVYDVNFKIGETGTTSNLSDSQVDKLEEIYNKHFS